MSHAGMQLLEQALLIGALELEALSAGRIEEAAAREEERSRLTLQAIELSGDVPLDMLMMEFQKLCELQKSLTQAGNELRLSRQQEMSRARGENRRLAGYKQAAAHALK
ncbi:MAG: hypothetical protein LBH94_00705 [Deltaproteobacteria bacterium]|jgi:hypothetical protein|nr:hypothetical protein [Deltaproteobacteria bacterium]